MKWCTAGQMIRLAQPLSESSQYLAGAGVRHDDAFQKEVQLLGRKLLQILTMGIPPLFDVRVLLEEPLDLRRAVMPELA
jgi:hypothetical protein